MKKFKINLQLFAGEGAGENGEGGEGSTGEVVKTVPYERFSTVNKELKAEREAKLALEEQIKAFQGYVPASELETAKTAAEKAYNEKLDSITKSSELKLKLVSTGLEEQYTALVMSQVDLSKLNIQDGKIIGLDDVVNGLKEKYPKMFGEEKKPAINNTGSNPKGQPPAGGLTEEEKLRAEIRRNMGLK